MREYIRKVDSVNFVRACGIVAKYGWIDEKCVRGKYADVESVKSSLYAIFYIIRKNLEMTQSEGS